MRGEGSGNHDEQTPPGRSSDRARGFVALVQAVRSLPERLKRPESLIMLMAMLASLGAHMPPYVGLGALAEYWEKLEHEKPKRAEPVEVSFELAEPTKPEEPKLEQPNPEAPKPEQAKLEPKKPEEEAKKAEPEKPKPELPQPKVAVSELKLPDPPKPEERKQSVTQKSEDPNVQPPPDAKFLAEENRVVEEETVAKVTSETRDDPDPTEAAPNTGDEQERFGEDAKQDQRGAERGSEEEEPPKVASLEPKQTQHQPSLPPPPEPTQTPQPARPSIKPAPAPAPSQQPQIIHDPLGSFVLAPQRPVQPGREGQAARAGVAGNQANIKVSWRAFEETFGAEQLAQDRMPREAKRRGAGREKKWAEFRAAIENYVVGVKPGNQTKLNAAADPFAAYLAAFHRNLHMEFAHEFLGSLPALGDLGDLDLVTKVEIVVNPDGTLDRVGIVKSSGNLMYDFGAFNAVQRGAPYPPAPEKIRSSDGRVYMRWALHRNESQCGTWNAEPYILKDPPRSPNDPKPDNVSPFLPAGEKGEHGRAPKPEPVKAPAALPPGETLGEDEHAKFASKA